MPGVDDLSSGCGQSDVILYWDEIVSARLAAMSQPVKLNWPPRW